jgi:integrase
MPAFDNNQSLPKYVVREIRANGSARLRFKRRGWPVIQLPALDSKQFETAYKAALNGKKPPIGASRTRSGTLNELIVSLLTSAYWRDGYKGSTRDGHRYRLDQLREKHGDKPATDLDAKHLHAMLAKLTPVNQKNWIKTFRVLYRHAIAVGLAERDPSAGYKLPKIVTVPHKRWQDEDIEQFRICHPIGTKARLALELLIHTGLRKSDIVRLGPQHVRKGKIRIATEKTGAYLELPFPPELASIIAETKVVGTITYLVTKHGEPHTVKGFGNYMRDWCNEAGLPDLSAHGIRHAIGAQMSEEGATEREIMAVLGHSDPRMAMHYTKQANQARLAASAFAKLKARWES